MERRVRTGHTSTTTAVRHLLYCCNTWWVGGSLGGCHCCTTYYCCTAVVHGCVVGGSVRCLWCVAVVCPRVRGLFVSFLFFSRHTHRPRAGIVQRIPLVYVIRTRDGRLSIRSHVCNESKQCVVVPLSLQPALFRWDSRADENSNTHVPWNRAGISPRVVR